MDTKMYALLLRLQSEQIQKLVIDLIDQLVAFEEAVNDDSTSIHIEEIGKLSQNIETEVERLQHYLRQSPHMRE